MNPVRTALLAMLLLACGALGVAQAAAAEPTIGFNGWTNTPGQVEGQLNVRPVDTTLPRPTYGYLEYLPKGYNASDTTTKWPVLFVLNGLGETGDGTDTVANGHQLTVKMTTNGPLFDVATLKWDFPSIVISPQSGGVWNQNNIKLMIDYVKANYRVDTSRIFMTGLADGASGLFRFATTYPGILAGAIPIETTYSPTTSAESDAIKHLPLWLVHAFSDAPLNRRATVAWINQATQADTGLTSDVMAAYPGYGGTNTHYACDTDPATGLPLNPAGPVSTVASAVLTTGNATATLSAGNLIANAGSFYVALWTGSDAAPFTRVQYGSDATSYVVKAVGSTGILASKAFSGPSQTADAHITTPVGLVLSAYYQPATGTWAWPRTSAQTPPPAGTPDNRILTLYWQYDQTAAWSNTYVNGQVWDWLYARPPLTGPVTPATVTLGGLSTVYTGSAQAPTITTSPAGLAVSTTYNGAAALPINAGSYAVVSTITNPAYTGSATGTLTIAAAPVAISLSSLAATWDGTPKQATATTSPANVALTVVYSSGAAPVEPGSYTVTASPAATNYTGAPATGTLTIAKANASITLGQLTVTADGSPKPVPTTTVPANLTVALTYNGSSTAPSAPGTYAVAATITDAHYQGATTGSLTISAAPVGVLTVAEHGDHQVVQRAIGTTSGTVQFTGTLSGPAVNHVDARIVAIVGGIVAHDWTTIASAPAGGTWSGTLPVPQGGWYRVEVRSIDAGGAVLASAASTVPWGVGINILCIGQSNMVGYGDLNFTTANDLVGLLRNGAGWQHLADPWINGGKASCGPALGNALVAALGIPVGLVPAATLDTTMNANGPTDLSFRNAANPSDTSTVYGKALRAAAAAGGVEFVCVSQGAAEAFAGTTSTAVYVAAFTQMETNFHGDLANGAQVKFVLSQLGRRIANPVADAGYDAIREAHRLLDDGVNTLLAGSTVDFPLADGITHYGQAGQDPHGRRFARAILFSLGQRATYGGPRIASAAFNDPTRTVVLVTIAHRGGSDFQPGSAIPGFAVSDASGPKIVSAARVSGSVIALTTTTACSGATTITYLEGMNPAGPLGLFADNQADPEPLLPLDAPLAVQPPPITQAIVTLSGLNATYDGNAHAATVITTPANISTSTTYDGGLAAPVGVGPHAVVVTVTDPAYVGGTSGTLTIVPGTATAVIGGVSAVYDGNAHAVTVTTSPPNLNATITYDGGNAAPVASGAHAVVVTIVDANYTGGATGSLVITKAVATVALGGLAATYDGTAHQATVTTAPANLATTLTYDGAAAAPVNAGAHAVVATVSDANYTGSATASLVIAKAAATVTLSGLSAQYDGTAHAATATTVPAGLQTSITYDGAAAAPVASGDHAVVATITDPNYSGSATATLNIGALVEPTIGFNGWTNIPGVVEGSIVTFPVDTTLPKPPLGFVAYFPKGYNQADTTTKWPMVMYFAGLGEAGDGTDTDANGHYLYTKMTTHGPLYQVLTYHWDFPAIIIAPQCPQTWGSINSIKAEVEYAKANFHVDTKHLYMTGLCDGACGLLHYAATYPNDLAAMLPIEAGQNPGTGQAAAIKDIPMWAAHCFADPESTARGVSILWVDGSTGADTGTTSDVMANYPGYGSTPRNHYACDSDPLTGFPLLPNGPTNAFSGASLTANNKYVAFGSGTSLGSSIYLMWSGSTDTQPFARFYVNGTGSNADYWAKAGVMLRDSTAAGAKQVIVAQMPNNEVAMQWRDTTNGGSNWFGVRVGGTDLVKTVKLVKAGNLFTGLYSTDGVTFTSLGSVTVAFDNATYAAGLAISAHNNGTTYTQPFSKVAINGAAPGALTDTDIGVAGDPGIAGSASLAGGVYTVTGGGSDIWNNGDNCNFDYQAASGDTTISAQVGTNVPAYNLATVYPTGFYTTKPYAGPTATAAITIVTPVGYNLTGSFAPGAGWSWARDQHLDRTKPGKHIFTMFWYQDHVQGWRDTWGNPEVWNWMFSKTHP